MTDQAGRATALTLATPLRPLGALWARTLFGAARRMSWVTAPLRTMSLIHFARWSLIERLPADPQKLSHPVLFFESNFDGALWEYVDAFAYVLAWRMRAVWWRSFGYPGLIPTDGFTSWVMRHSAIADHYYFAYPDASPKMIKGAVAVLERFSEFQALDDNSNDEAFAREYLALVTDVQEHL